MLRRRSRALCLTLATATTLAAGCAPMRPHDSANYDSLRVSRGMTQFDVQKLLGKPKDAEELAFGTVWTYRYKAGGYPLLRTLFIFPLFVTMPFFFTTSRYWKSFKKRSLRLIFDDRARVSATEILDRSDDALPQDHLIPIAQLAENAESLAAPAPRAPGAEPTWTPGVRRGPTSALPR